MRGFGFATVRKGVVRCINAVDCTMDKIIVLRYACSFNRISVTINAYLTLSGVWLPFN